MRSRNDPKPDIRTADYVRTSQVGKLGFRHDYDGWRRVRGKERISASECEEEKEMKRERGKKREPLFSSFFIQKCLFSSFSILKKVIYLCSPNRSFIVYNTGYNTNFLFIGKTLLSLSALRNVNVLIQIKTSILFSFFEPAQIKNWG